MFGIGVTATLGLLDRRSHTARQTASPLVYPSAEADSFAAVAAGLYVENAWVKPAKIKVWNDAR